MFSSVSFQHHPAPPDRRRPGPVRLVVAALVVIGAVLVAGCGSVDGETTAAAPGGSAVTTAAPAGDDTGDDTVDPSGDAAPDGAVDACALLADADLEAILGVPVADATTEETYGDYVCDVRPADESVRAQFKLVVDADQGTKNFPRQRDLAADPEPVTGLGDEAFRSGANLFVLDDGMLLHTNVVRAPTATGDLTTAQLSEVLAGVLDNLHGG